MRITELHDTSVERLLAAGVSEAAVEVPILLCHVLGLSRTRLFLEADSLVDQEKAVLFEQLLQRRLKREPLAHITGEKEFWSLSFLVNGDVLVPRPETELLIEKAIDAVHNDPVPVTSALDLGTGSGIIAVTLARELPRLRVFAVDKSLAALRIAAVNAERIGVSERVCFINADWLSFLSGKECFDLVVSNPPYVVFGDLPGLAPEVRDFEPRLALDGGADGLASFRVLVTGIASVVRQGGHVFFEIGYDQGDSVIELLQGTGEYCEILLHKDYAGLARLVQAQKK